MRSYATSTLVTLRSHALHAASRPASIIRQRPSPTDDGSAAGAVRGAASAAPPEAHLEQLFVPSDRRKVLRRPQRTRGSGIKHCRVAEFLGAMDALSGPDLRDRWATRGWDGDHPGIASSVTGTCDAWLEANADSSETAPVGNGDLYAWIGYAMGNFSDGVEGTKNTSGLGEAPCGTNPEFGGCSTPVTANGPRERVRTQRGFRSGQNNSASACTLATTSRSLDWYPDNTTAQQLSVACVQMRICSVGVGVGSPRFDDGPGAANICVQASE
ncbi:hypothetical protein DL770_010731 [Monosporascus sp. CRB-9-2]|nr:hypothetical protein DL770_010731 [Monosporascus sp. CRB-9-2]